MAQQLLDKASYSLVRTNPKLTGNVKIVSDGTDIYLESFSANTALSGQRYKAFKVDGTSTYDRDVFRFFNNEYNFLSRKLLQILDFFGNYQNKTNLPKKYFTKSLFNELVEKSNLKIVKSIKDKNYYPWFFLFFNNPKLHFISILKKNDT